MKILVVSQYFYPETFRVNTLARELVERGHDVTVLTGYPQYPQGELYDGYAFDRPYDPEWHGVKIIRLKVTPRGKSLLGMIRNCFSYVQRGNRWVKKCKEKYDAIYVFETSPVTVGLPAVTYKKKFGTPIFFNVQDLWPENVQIVLGVRNKLVIGVINKIVDKIYGASDRILCSSPSFVENIANRGVPQDKLVYWPQFCIEPALDGMTKPDCYTEDHFNIVFTGNLGDAQGLDLMIEAADRLKDTRLRWFLVGDGRAGERLGRLVAERGLEDHVIFVGRVSEKEANRYIRFADCAYLSFKNNQLFDMTIPAKLQSYLACGTPILAAAGGESARIIREAACGFACAQEVDALCRVIREQLLPAEHLGDMGKNGYRYYKENFCMDDLVSRLEQLMAAAVETPLAGHSSVS